MRKARVSGRLASAIQPRTPLRAEGEYASKWSRAPGRSASARARSSGTTISYAASSRGQDPAAGGAPTPRGPGPGSVGGARLPGTSPGFGHQPGRFQPRAPFPVGSRPDASPAARGEPNHGALAVDPTGPAVDPAEA